MLTNNKKSYFAKGIAVLMALLMVLSVCLTGCGKAAEEAANKAQTSADAANTKAEEAKTAADAVKAELAKYLTTADGATKAEVNKLIEDALAPYAKSENVAADLAKFVKSEDFDNLVASLETYVTKAALTEALKDVATDAEVKKLTDDLAANVAANKGNIDKALNDLKAVATDAEVEAIKKALEDKIAAGDKAASDALKNYVTTTDMNAIQTALQGKIDAANKAASDVAASLAGYVKADEYALLVSSVQEATFKLMTIDREHYAMVMETLAPYIADQEALAESVNYLADELAMIDKKHADYVNEILAGYTTSADFELLTGAVATLDEKLWDLQMNAKEQIANLTNELDLVEAGVQRLDAALYELHMNVKAELANYAKQDAFELLTARVEAIAQNGIDMGKEIQGALVNYATKAEVEALDGRLDKLEEVVRAILAAFYGEEETLDGELEDMLDMPAEAITGLIKDKMSLTEWNKTTPEVIKTIEVVQTLMAKLYATEADGKLTYAYTKAAKKEINSYLAALNIVIYDEDYKLVPQSESIKNIEYTLLRVATLAELNELKEAIAKACAVKSFSDELDALWNASLYTIGHTHKVSDTLTVQTVTIENKAEINAFVDAYDNLIVKYLLDNAYAGTKYDVTYGTQKTYNVFEKDGVKKIADLDKYYEKTDDKGNPIYWTKVDVTILIEDATGTDYATSQKNGVEFQKKDAYGLFYLPQDIAEYDWADGVTTSTAVDGHYGNQSLTVAATYKNNEGTYKALIAQTKDAQDKVNDANTTMNAFLSTVVKAEGIIAGANGPIALSTIDAPSDAQYLEALTVGMCTYTETEGAYAMYLLNQVQTAMNKALARNTCENAKHTAREHSDVVKAAIDKYNLYFQMFDKAWELTFDLFQSYARTMIAEILADYISVVDYIKANGADYSKTADFYNQDVNKKLSSDFLPAFLNGAAFSGWTSKTSGNYNAILIENDFTATALKTYEVLNGTAKDATGAAIMATPAATIAQYSEQLRMYLTSASLYAMAEINGATVEAAKAKDSTQVNVLFVDALNTMVDGLDEVFNRFLFEDYKKVQINAVYAYATQQANFYSYNGELANGALIEAMEHYLTGYSATASTKAEGTANKLFPAVEKLENASLTTDMAAITVDKFAKIDGTAPVALTATAKKTDVNTLAASFKEDLTNMAIKTYFQTYLDEATQNIARAYLDYMNAQNTNGSFVLTYDMINRLVARRNYADTEISVKKFQDLMGNIAFDNYKTEYANVLKLISGKKQAAHLEALTGYTFDKLTSTTEADETMGLKSALALNYVNTALNDVVRPMDVLGTGAQANNYVGMTIRYFDEIVNVNTQYLVPVTVEGVTTYVATNLY